MLGRFGIVASLPLPSACRDADWSEVVFVAYLDEVGEDPVEFEYPEGFSAFAVALSDDACNGVGTGSNVVAFHRACPHQGCFIDQVDAGAGTLGPCACHASLFDIRRCGVQISGRASTRLSQVKLEIRGDDELWAVGFHGVVYGSAFNVAKGLDGNERLT